MIIGFTGAGDAGKTTTATHMEKYGWKRQREYISDFIPPEQRMVGKTYDDPQPFIRALEELHAIHARYEKSGENIIMDRTIYDSHLLASILLSEGAFEKYYEKHKKIKNKIHYDHLVFFEVLPLKNEINGYEIMTEMLFNIKIKPRCDIICVADTIENRINHILNKIGGK
jgi:predicted ATPase